MKKQILILLLASTIFSSYTIAKEPLNSIPSKIIPFGWELGKTTCDEVEKKLPKVYHWDDGIKMYGVKQRISFYCNSKEKGYSNLIYIGIFYTERSLNKIGLSKSMTSSEVANVLLNNFNLQRDDLKFSKVKENGTTGISIDDSNFSFYLFIYKGKLDHIDIRIKPEF
jgi:hypothetical protein